MVDRLENHIEASQEYDNEESVRFPILRRKKTALTTMWKRQFCVTVSLDIKNALNMMPWQQSLVTLVNAVKDEWTHTLISNLDEWISQIHGS